MGRTRIELSNAASRGSIRPLVFEIAVGVGSDPTTPGGRGYGNSPGGAGLTYNLRHTGKVGLFEMKIAVFALSLLTRA